jgi:hypothetical protein
VGAARQGQAARPRAARGALRRVPPGELTIRETSEQDGCLEPHVLVDRTRFATRPSPPGGDATDAGAGPPSSADDRDSWLTTLGLLKAAGAAGLALGLAGVPLVGTAAALGLTLFFVGAIATHLRAHNHDLAFPGAYLALAVGSLVLSVAA